MNTFLIFAFLFFAGCIVGWFLELLFRRFNPSNKSKKWINPGFLQGPYLPIYGLGICVLYFLARLEDFIHIDNTALRRIILFIIMAAAMTLIEYIAGMVFIVRMKVKLWDYSGQRGNIKGIICPLFSFFWAVLGAIYYFLIDPYILDALRWLSNNLAFSFVIGFFYGIFCIDVWHSFRLAGKIKSFADEHNIIVRYEELKSVIRQTAEERREKYSFLLPLRDEGRISERLKEYLDKQRESEKLQNLESFISSKIKR